MKRNTLLPVAFAIAAVNLSAQAPPSLPPQGKSLTLKVTDFTRTTTFEVRDFAVSGSPERGYRAVAVIFTADRNVGVVTISYELKSLRTGEITTGTLENKPVIDGLARVEFDCGPDPCELTQASISGSTGGLVDVRGKRPTPNPNGDYRWKYVTATGVTREFVFNPGRNVVPEIDIRVSPTTEDGYFYDYAIANALVAGQNIQSILVDDVFPARAVGAPAGWRSFQPSKVARRASWFTSGPGIQPGQQIARFQLTSSRLPGTARFTFSGDNRLTRLKSEDYPPAEIQDEINSLIGEHRIVVQSLAPTIDRGSPRSDLVINIRRSYRQAVLASSHPAKATIAEELDRLVDVRGNVENLNAAISQLTKVLGAPAVNRWDTELAAGLLICIQHLSHLDR